MRISFDVWGTLITHNPEFKNVKNDLIRKYSTRNPVFLTDNQINDQIKAIKKTHDTIIEIYGTQPSVYHLFAELAFWFQISPSDLDKFMEEYQQAFLNTPPTLYDENTLDVLCQLNAEGHKLYISSNTLFIKGNTLSKALEKLGVCGYPKPITAARFSDNLGCSKPHHNMFYHGSDYHVGDNPKTDGSCVSFGIKFFEINSNDKTIKDFYEHIQSVSLCKEN